MLFRPFINAAPLILIAMASTALADDAVWTGEFQRLEEEKPNVSLWACKYLVDKKNPRLLIFEDFCPSTVDIHRYDYESKYQRCCVNDAGKKTPTDSR